MTIRQSAYAMLDQVAKVNDRAERTVAIRELCQKYPALGLCIQYAYHPDVEFELPEGPFPEHLYKKSGHDAYGIFHQNVKKLRNLWKSSPVKPQQKETLYRGMLEYIPAEDIPLLEGIRMKNLPWKNLGGRFCAEALPELFPGKDAA